MTSINSRTVPRNTTIVLLLQDGHRLSESDTYVSFRINEIRKCDIIRWFDYYFFQWY